RSHDAVHLQPPAVANVNAGQIDQVDAVIFGFQITPVDLRHAVGLVETGGVFGQEAVGSDADIDRHPLAQALTHLVFDFQAELLHCLGAAQDRGASKVKHAFIDTFGRHVRAVFQPQLLEAAVGRTVLAGVGRHNHDSVAQHPCFPDVYTELDSFSFS